MSGTRNNYKIYRQEYMYDEIDYLVFSLVWP